MFFDFYLLLDFIFIGLSLYWTKPLSYSIPTELLIAVTFSDINNYNEFKTCNDLDYTL